MPHGLPDRFHGLGQEHRGASAGRAAGLAFHRSRRAKSSGIPVCGFHKSLRRRANRCSAISNTNASRVFWARASERDTRAGPGAGRRHVFAAAKRRPDPRISVRRNGSGAAVIWLDCPMEEPAAAMCLMGDRPLFRDEASFRKLYQERLPYYQQADYRVESGGEPMRVVEQILALGIFEPLRARAARTESNAGEPDHECVHEIVRNNSQAILAAVLAVLAGCGHSSAFDAAPAPRGRQAQTANTCQRAGVFYARQGKIPHPARWPGRRQRRF